MRRGPERKGGETEFANNAPLTIECEINIAGYDDFVSRDFALILILLLLLSGEGGGWGEAGGLSSMYGSACVMMVEYLVAS